MGLRWTAATFLLFATYERDPWIWFVPIPLGDTDRERTKPPDPVAIRLLLLLAVVHGTDRPDRLLEELWLVGNQ